MGAAVTREQLVKLARECAGGIHRPTLECDASYEDDRGGIHIVTVECSRCGIRNSASYDPPEWVLEAMAKAFTAGQELGRRDGAGLYPEAG